MVLFCFNFFQAVPVLLGTLSCITSGSVYYSLETTDVAKTLLLKIGKK